MPGQRVRVIPAGAALGAEIAGVDLSRDLDDAEFRRIEVAFNEHGVIFFRGRKWDNCACRRLAIKGYGLPQRRLMHRVTVTGPVPF